MHLPYSADRPAFIYVAIIPILYLKFLRKNPTHLIKDLRQIYRGFISGAHDEGNSLDPLGTKDLFEHLNIEGDR